MLKPKPTPKQIPPGQQKREHKKAAFLKVFRNNGGRLFTTCELVGVHNNTVWEWRQKDPEFAEKYNTALEATTDDLEKEMERRALKKSDLLMIFTLKGRRPAKYRDNVKVEHGVDSTVKELLLREDVKK